MPKDDWRPSWAQQVAVEVRVLGLRRTVRDTFYFWWCMAWLGMPMGPLWALQHVPFLEGCRGYFEWRDGNEFPAINRWLSLRFARWRRAAAK